MTLSQGKWVKLPQKGSGPGARSSHAVAVVDDKAYVFGGEFAPRVPVDNHLYVFDLHLNSWSLAPVSAGDPPPPRVGVTMAAVGPTIYVFGGRDAEHRELGELYAYDTNTAEWSLLSSGTDEASPPPRSYHSTVSDGDSRVYIFGGCGVAGRLNDLWAFDVVDRAWSRMPDVGNACLGRGGPGLAVAGGRVWVVYGFSGVEQDDVHCFDPVSGEWAQVETGGEKPTARSVFSITTVGDRIIIYGGEVDPSDLGHMGAGKFAGQMYGLDTRSGEWKKWEDRAEEGAHPGPRGWCAFSGGRHLEEEGLLVYGGNSPTNDRLDDLFFFTPSL